MLSELVEAIATGRLEIPIAGVYHLADVREAYKELEKRYTHGKIVLVPQTYCCAPPPTRFCSSLAPLFLLCGCPPAVLPKR